MKNLFSALAILSIIFATSCSKTPENNDPVIGIWAKVEINAASETAKSSTTRKEWIFNDAYLGRYHRYENESVEVLTDFRWSEANGVYTITYPGLSDKEDQFVSMKTTNGITVLEKNDGSVLANRE